MLDKGGHVCPTFIVLSKTFDTIHHDLMIPKLIAYGFPQDVLQYMRSYVTNRQQRVIFFFFSNSYLRNHVNDNSLHAFGFNLEEMKNTLRFDFD